MQRLKKAVKKIVTLGTGLGLIGATFAGAVLAQPTLDTFPEPYIVGGVYDDSNALVVGRNAAASDTIGVANIAKGLQFESKVCTVGSTGSSSVAVSGDAAEV